MRIEIRNLKFYPDMSEETNAITCDLYVDGKKTAHCKNDGHGGSTDYFPYENQRPLLEKTEKYAKTLPEIEYEWNGKKHYFKSDLEAVINNEVEKQLHEKEAARMDKKLTKDCQKYICLKHPNGYTSIGWKNYTLSQLLATPVGLLLVQQKVDELKSKGETILNKNLTGIKM